MNNTQKFFLLTLFLLALVAGVLLGSGLGDGATKQAGSGKAILYWVAPMDPNYRRNGPGKSPMGMDLIPVYAGDEKSEPAGTVTISPQVENNLGVRTATAQQGPVATEINAVGLVQLDEDKLHHVHTRLSGWVHKTWVKAVGDRVEKGQPLLEIYSPELVKAQSELVAALASGNRTLIQATRERLNSLGIPAAHIQRLEETREVSQTITLRAHGGGYVNALGARDGMYITPSTNLMGIGPLDTVWVEAELFPKQAGLIKDGQVQSGQSISIHSDFAPDRQWHGERAQWLPDLDPKTRTLRLRIAVDNPDKSLRPGMFVRLKIPGASVNALTVPRSALIRTGEMDRLVIAEGDGRFRSLRVRAGRELGDRVEILEGLKPGAEVVTSAQFLLDSESSISADLTRIHGKKTVPNDNTVLRGEALWVEARVLSMPDDNHYARLQHAPLPQWDWPAMTMGFYVADGAQAGLRSALENDAPVMVQLRQRADGKYEVIAMRGETGDGDKP
ncbi:efflux RND transporter periplasmic adaptor subunit [uncultured Microbulbifer sp.]|uniref:efflux RND transporter periplasmic adaptor subunit n=1 Tax=uncultured Microbulbifer sp. TaxID=348147 RepID=UPI00262D9A3B|nr:efflux RND transporter periplasmic adaptor subunit [uncultured Microbulbifer sp.]